MMTRTRCCKVVKARPCCWLCLLLFVLIPAMSQAAGAETYWQLTVRYQNSSLEVVEADEIPAMAKAVRTPGLYGAPLRVQYQATWLDDAGNELLTTDVEFPLGSRMTMPAEGEPSYDIPADSTFVVRLKGPASGKLPKSLRLHRVEVKGPALQTATLPQAFSAIDRTVAIPASTPRLASPGPYNCVKIHDTGPDSNRYVIVVMGDGYTRANLNAGLWTAAANDLVTSMPSLCPWDKLMQCVNIYRIDVESNEEGIDRSISATEPMVDTYFDSSMYYSNIPRAVTIGSTGRSKAQAAANTYVGVGVWDKLIVNLNTPIYAGSGGQIMLYTNNSAHHDLIWHEMGHSFAGLADEYPDSAMAAITPLADPEPNVDFDSSGAGLKWLAWVETGTPLPTPTDPLYTDINHYVVGAFEGARYVNTGIYRPCYWCEMRGLGFQFCPVCREAHITSLLGMLNKVDGFSPAANSVNLPMAGTKFTINAVPLDGITYQWYVGSQPLAGETAASITRMREGHTSHQYSLSCHIGYSSNLVRKSVSTTTYSWTVQDDGIPINRAQNWSLYR